MPASGVSGNIAILLREHFGLVQLVWAVSYDSFPIEPFEINHKSAIPLGYKKAQESS